MKARILVNAILLAMALPFSVNGLSAAQMAPAEITNQVQANAGYLGVILGAVPGALRAQLASVLPAGQGVMIQDVAADSPAAKAGLRGVNPTTNLGGDVIVSVDGRSITAFDDLLGFIVQETAVGQTVQLDILRDGNIITVDLTLEARPDSNQ